MADNIENANSQNGEVDLDIDFGDTTDPEQIKAKAKEVLAQKVSEFEENNKQLYARAKKAEGFELVDGKWVKPSKPATEQKPTAPATTSNASEQKQDLSQIDVIALIKADVTLPEDIDTVKEYATLKKITVAEALKSATIKAIINERSEERKTAQATSTGTTRRATSKPSSESILVNATQGKLPDNPEDLAAARAEARLKGR